MRVITIEALLQENSNLANENIALKKHINDRKIQSVAKEVASPVNNWLEAPYKDGKTTQQDINDFSLQITRYVDHRLHD